jgi:hypothetical protein
MKDHRFIELLNLYIDRQITAEETAELEAEIQSSPQRQAVYRQYCQIHSATKLVYQSFRASATDPVVTPSGRPATIEQFEQRRRVSWVHYAGGFAAAAACAALLFVRHNATPTVEAPVASLQTVAVAPAPTAAITPAVASATAVVMPAAPKNLISLRNTSPSPDYSAMLVALREQDEERVLAERWQTTRSQSLFDDNLFDAKHTLPASARPVESRPQNSQAEFTAFQFQR